MNLTPQERVINPRIADKTLIKVSPRYLWTKFPKDSIRPAKIKTNATAVPVTSIPYSFVVIIIVVIEAGPAKTGVPIIAAIAGDELPLIESGSAIDFPNDILIPNMIRIIPPAILKSEIDVLNISKRLFPKRLSGKSYYHTL